MITTVEDRIRIYGASRICLCQRANGELGRHYLTVQRGLDWGTISAFRLGFIPFSVNERLFQGKVMIPIFDAYDRLLALSVRPVFDLLLMNNSDSIRAVDTKVADGACNFLDTSGKLAGIPYDQVEAKKTPHPKYWNESYSKGEHLFALNQAKYSIVKWGFAIVVEGQMDVIALHSRGITNAVGVLGGKLTPLQAMLLKRWTSQVVVLMDQDEAGKRHLDAAKEVLDVFSWQHGQRGSGAGSSLAYLCAQLPEGSDPDSFVRKFGGYALRQRIAEAAMTAKFQLPDNWLRKEI